MRILILGIIISLSVNLSFAKSLKINKITIRGNSKVSTEAIRAKIMHKKGEPIRRFLIRQDIQSIFDLGFFDNIKVLKNVTRKGIELVFEVKEKPIVSSIIFEGNSEVDDDDLEKEIDITPYTVLDISKIKRAKTRLLDYYEEKGFYLASVKDELRSAPPDEEAEIKVEYLELVFKISEGSKIRVNKISLLGNRNIHEEEIKRVMETKEKGVFSWISGSGSYRESIVRIDRERIAFFYTTRGYPHVKVTGPITHVTADKKWIYLTYSIEEGEKYSLGEIDFKSSGLLFTEEELRERLILKTGEIYNSMEIREQIVEYQNMYGDKGYAFTNVIPLSSYNEDKRTVDIVFDIDKGRKVYFGEFTVVGNNKTRDKVIRRELRIYEGELYNHSKKELSRQKIMALGFFESVVFHQYVPKVKTGAKPNVVNIEIRVKERPSTGQFMISAGYSSYEGFITMIQVQENNFLGRGQVVTLRANLSKISTLYYLGFFDPYFLDTNWGWGLDIYRERREAIGFDVTRSGFNTRLGYPLTDFIKFYVSYKLENSKTAWIETLSNIFDPDIENGFTSSMIFTLERDKRNNRLDPTRGFYQAISTELAGFGGSKYFVKTILDGRYYRPLFWATVLKTRLLLGNVSGYANKSLPYSERFLMGGIDSLRGYDYLTLGPQVLDTSGNLYAVGGKNKIMVTAELEFPILTQAGIRGVVFLDMGNSFNKILSGFTTDVPLRANWGLGFRWHSPMGPLRFEWGVPINRRPGESKSVFQFMIGPSF